jgi:glycosyltransferase involved in cell wall biosynthesis
MPSCIISFPYYYPDDLVSARHITDLAEGLCFSGWNVKILAGNRYHTRAGKIIPHYEIRNGVKIIRSWYPYFSNSRHLGRLINSFCFSMILLGKLLFITADVILFGTNPSFLYYIIPFLSFFRSKARFVLWGFDLYPEAVFADDIKIPKIIEKFLFWWAGISYRRFGFLVDIGSCMRSRFCEYHPRAKHETIVPWAIQEPSVLAEPDCSMRSELFGDAKLGILYSGTIGRAHQFEEFIFLARELRKRNASVAFCFAGKGNRYKELHDMITPEDVNITFAGFIEESRLSLRLAAADMHMISLRNGWEGVSVPSKFFGSLAAGRPLLYCGTPNSCVAELINEHKLGFIVKMNKIKAIADILEEISHNKNRIHQMQEHVFLFYGKHFSKKIQLMKWDCSLRDYIKASD